ncbi:MAG: HAMP domain-containing protein [Acidobacteriota bacterium]|nr:MAG: HAMP domain-containing protein [Acidobacteriota bacterium]
MLIIVLLASLFFMLALGFFVLVSAPHRAVNRMFAAFIGMMILWIAKDLLFWGFHGPEHDATWWATVSFLIGIVLQIVFLLFTEVFPENSRPRWRRIILLSLPLVILIPWLFSGKLWISIGYHHDRFGIRLTRYAYVFGLYNYLVLGLGVWTLIRKYRRYRKDLWGKQIASVVAAVLVTGTLLIVTNNVMPALGNYSLMPISSIFIVIGALIYAYAITNLQLFSLQTALDQLRLFPIAYKVALAVSLTGLAGFFLIQVPVAIWALDGDILRWKKFLIFSTLAGTIPSMILVLVIVRILSRPLRELTEVALDVARGNYGAETDLRSNDELGVLASSFNVMSRKMAEDIARLKEINQVMIRTEKLATAGSLATSVAHEVNNPLASISSLVQGLLSRESSEAGRQTLRLILSQITRISGVLRDLMDFARPKAHEPRPSDLNRVILKSLELAKYDKRFKQLAVRTELSPGLPMLALDNDKMQQVFFNLLINARDAIAETERSGEIVIRTTHQNGSVNAEVSDNGAGIPPENLNSIFDPFFTTKTKGNGTGLGLAVCQSIILTHGGRITAENRSDGEGSTFRITFPVSKVESQTS